MSAGAKHLHGDRPAYLSACKRLTRSPSALRNLTKGNMTNQSQLVERVIGFDCHPDTFTAAILCGPTPAAAITERTFNQLNLDQLADWTEKNTTTKDLIVLEASGNSFHVARTLEQLKRNAVVLESCHLGKLKEAHANNDKISAVRIGKAYLAGTAKKVWVPDLRTQERRDLFHLYNKAVKRATQTRNRLKSYLSDNGVRLKLKSELTQERLEKARDWSPMQWEVVRGYLIEWQAAEKVRRHWRSVIAQQTLDDPQILSLIRLCGIRDVVAFALTAFIGKIDRFDNPKKLVKYIGLNPAFDDSGQSQWRGGISGHGRKDLRSLLIEAAQSILRSKDPLARWGKKLMARKSSKNLAVAAVARKLAVAVWYVMNGKTEPIAELDAQLTVKLYKITAAVGTEALNARKINRRELKAAAAASLKSVKVYQIDPNKKFEAKPKLEIRAV